LIEVVELAEIVLGLRFVAQPKVSQDPKVVG